MCKVSPSFNDRKLDFHNSGFHSFWSVNYKPDESSLNFFAILCLHISSLTFGKRFMSKDPVVPEITGGGVDPTPPF